MKDLKTILSLAVAFLEKNKVTRPRFVAETLLAYVLGLKRIELYMSFDRPLTENELEKFRSFLKRALTHEPIEYIMGEVEFYHTKLKVNPSVLIPRQETEILLDKVIKSLDGTEKNVLDLCTGSGCLAIGLKKARPELNVVAVDISEEALAVAKENAQLNGVEVEFLQGDLTNPVNDKKFDLVVCNPPYVTEGEYVNLEKGVKDFEPKMALVGGPTGLEFYERLNKEISHILLPNAKVFFEIGTGQGKELIQKFSHSFWKEFIVEKDWSGHDRFFCIKKN